MRPLISSGKFSPKLGALLLSARMAPTFVKHRLEGLTDEMIVYEFAREEQRRPFRQLAEERGAPFLILDFQASDNVLRERLVERRKDASDADLAVLDRQLAAWGAGNRCAQSYGGAFMRGGIHYRDHKPGF